LEDQNIVNNNLFIDTYYKYSTDKTYKNEILKIGNAIQLLKPNYDLPIVELTDANENKILSENVISKNTVIFFWTGRAITHFETVHKKVLAFKKKYPNYQFIAINLNDSQEEWKKILSNYNFNGITELRCANFEEVKTKWAITRPTRTIIIGDNAKIKNAFTNIFDFNFEDNLK
jgi:quinolinate synthase